MTLFKYSAIRVRQSEGSNVMSFAAQPKDILSFAEIDRVGRDDKGVLKGFQRHQIASHIKEIRDYLSRDDAILPNPIVVAFIDGVQIREPGSGLVELTIDASEGKPGYVVDGQQRLSALSTIEKPGFEVFVSCLVCRDYNELRQQFVLINSTRPLPKSLIYELLPTVEGLPERFTARSFAARLVDLLNYEDGSSLQGMIYQHTNPRGVIRDTALQKVVMTSSSDGAIRAFVAEPDYLARSFSLLSEFFGAVRKVFARDWEGMTPKTSRLVHGAGIVAMGYVMELLHSRLGASEKHEFVPALEKLKAATAWTSGTWNFSEGDQRPWNAIQNTSSDVDLLSNYLVREMRRALRRNVIAEVAETN